MTVTAAVLKDLPGFCTHSRAMRQPQQQQQQRAELSSRAVLAQALPKMAF